MKHVYRSHARRVWHLLDFERSIEPRSFRDVAETLVVYYAFLLGDKRLAHVVS